MLLKKCKITNTRDRNYKSKYKARVYIRKQKKKTSHKIKDIGASISVKHLSIYKCVKSVCDKESQNGS